MTRLKDILRATIVVPTFVALMLVHDELTALTGDVEAAGGVDLKIVGLKNRYYSRELGVVRPAPAFAPGTV